MLTGSSQQLWAIPEAPAGMWSEEEDEDDNEDGQPGPSTGGAKTRPRSGDEETSTGGPATSSEDERFSNTKTKMTKQQGKRAKYAGAASQAY